MIGILRNPKTVCYLISSKNIFVMFKAVTYTYYFSLTTWDMGKFFFSGAGGRKSVLCKLKTEILTRKHMYSEEIYADVTLRLMFFLNNRKSIINDV